MDSRYMDKTVSRSLSWQSYTWKDGLYIKTVPCVGWWKLNAPVATRGKGTQTINLSVNIPPFAKVSAALNTSLS